MGNFFKRLFQTEEGASESPLALNLSPAPPKPSKAQEPLPPSEKVPGNFFYFGYALDLVVAGTVHVGFPKIAIRDMVTGQVRWGERPEDPLALLEKPHLLWTDDPVRGVNARTLENPEDVLGAEGSRGGKHVRFERILDLGRNVVVYALFCPEEGFRTAYGQACKHNRTIAPWTALLVATSSLRRRPHGFRKNLSKRTQSVISRSCRNPLVIIE